MTVFFNKTGERQSKVVLRRLLVSPPALLPSLGRYNPAETKGSNSPNSGSVGIAVKFLYFVLFSSL